MLTMSHSIQEKNCKDNTVGRFRKFEFMFVGWTQALYPLTLFGDIEFAGG